MTDTALLRDIITTSGLKLHYIAEQVGLSSYGLQLKINGINEFKASEINALCELLKIDDLSVKERVFFAKKDDLKSP